jgi:homoserine O-succinyltransferase/O-acetyltransferase
MPVWLDSGSLGCRLFTTDQTIQTEERPKLPHGQPNRVEIGLVNNMADSALEQTERQILKLLHAASPELAVRLRLYALPSVLRGEWGRKHLVRLHYLNSGDLQNSDLDGLIITGAEPRAADLKQETYWDELAETFEWADENTISTVTSCLAVHAAVQHFDSIDRCPLDEKCLGIFDFDKVSSHALLKGVPQRLQMPHSRGNGIAERALLASGYEILTHSPNDGIDMFVKPKKSMFVFFQGHPEYEAWTLLGEYRRDIARFLSGDRNEYPAMPRAYFDDESARALNALRDRAIANPDKDLMTTFPTDLLAGRLADPWRPSAVRIYSNWLQWIAAQKADATSAVSTFVNSTAPPMR